MPVALLNGELADWLLVEIPWDSIERVRSGILADLIRLNNAFRARFGHNLIINESYRNLARQKAYYKNPPSGVGTAALPGTSNHGWGLALDLHLTHIEYLWMRANAPRYGWINPLWAHNGVGVEEPWHWEHATAPDVIPVIIPTQIVTIPEEDDMPLPAYVKIPGTAQTWIDLGALRRPISRIQYDADESPPIRKYPVNDPFWGLPIVGGPVDESYKRTGQEAVWLGAVVDGRFVRQWQDRASFDAKDQPPITVLVPEHEFWTVPVDGPLPPEGA